jgi:hypothetical protein
MRTIREMLRLKCVAQRSHRELARSLGVSPGAVASAVGRAGALALTWKAVEALSDDALEQRLYGPRAGDVAGQRPVVALQCRLNGDMLHIVGEIQGTTIDEQWRRATSTSGQR